VSGALEADLTRGAAQTGSAGNTLGRADAGFAAWIDLLAVPGLARLVSRAAVADGQRATEGVSASRVIGPHIATGRIKCGQAQ